MKKKALRILILFFAVILNIYFPMNILADENNSVTAMSTATSDKYNVMLLIDKSGSMNGTDASGLAKSAACQFIDQLCTVSNDLLDISAVTSVGVMSFAETTELISPVVSLNEEVNTDYLKSVIQGIQYLPSGTGGTDLSVAVDDALKQLEKTSVNGEKNLVVVFTDGYSENVINAEESNEKLNNAFELAKKLESEVFVVGLNHNGTIKEEGRQEIYKLADTTQRGSGVSAREKNDQNSTKDQVNYVITDDLNTVREFYGKIYASMIKSDLVYIENSHFTVDSTGILEADVTVYSNSKITDVAVKDPDGNKKIEDGKTYFESGDDYYRVIKILNPATGEWTVDVTSSGNDYKSYVVKFYGVEAAITASWDTGKNYSESRLETPYVGKVTLNPMYKGEPYTDELLENDNTVAEYWVKKENVDDSEGDYYTLSYSDGKFVGYFPVEQGIYNIRAHLANEIMDRTVECKLTVTNPEGVIDVELGDIKIKNQSSKTIDLTEKTGAEDLTIESLKIVPGDNTAVVDAEEGKDKNTDILLTANKTGQDNIEIVAVDTYKMKYHITGTVTVVFTMLWYHWIFIFVAIAAILALVYVILRKSKIIPGNFYISIELLESEEGYEGEFKEMEIPAPYGKTFSLWKLVNILKMDIDTHSGSSEGEKEISSALANEKHEIAKKTIFVALNARKNKIYKIKMRNGSRDLTSDIDCYKSPKLSIIIGFKGFFEDDSFIMEDDDFGSDTDFKKKTKTRRRKASSVFEDEEE